LGQNILFSCFLPENRKLKTNENVILPAVLYGCETWSLVQRKETRSLLIENRVLREIFGTKMEDVTRLQTAAWTGTAPLALNINILSVIN
jgi:hypothetical protein